MAGTLPTDIRETLPSFTVDGYRVIPPARQLDTKLYGRIKDLLTRLGGVWKKGAFQFQTDPDPLINSVLALGTMPDKNPSAFFPTPRAVIEEMLSLEDIPERLRLRAQLSEEYPDRCKPYRILEPNGGQGAIADVLRALPGNHTLDVVEPDEINLQVLRSKGYVSFCGRFEDFNSDMSRVYDLILMNPPFSLTYDKRAYITHIQRAFDMLDEGGILVAVAPTSFLSNTGSKERAFYDLISENAGGCIVALPDTSFRESGTTVNTCLVSLHRTSRNWKCSPYAGHANYFQWLFWMVVHNNASLNVDEQLLYEDFSLAKCEMFVDRVLLTARTEDSNLPAHRRDEYITLVTREYKTQTGQEKGTTGTVLQGDLFADEAA